LRCRLPAVRSSMEPAFTEPSLYPLDLVLWSISPLIWRRLLARSAMSLATLQTTLLLVFGWSYVPLHGFRIHGQAYYSAPLGRPASRGLQALCGLSLWDGICGSGSPTSPTLWTMSLLPPISPQSAPLSNALKDRPALAAGIPDCFRSLLPSSITFVIEKHILRPIVTILVCCKILRVSYETSGVSSTAHSRMSYPRRSHCLFESPIPCFQGRLGKSKLARLLVIVRLWKRGPFIPCLDKLACGRIVEQSAEGAVGHCPCQYG